MGNAKDIRFHVTELSSQISLGSKPIEISRNEPSQAPWPSHPQPLKETKLSKWVNIVYDVTLCAAPLLLLTKVGLVIRAAHIEKLHQLSGSVATVANPPSKLTTGLIDFNSQVSIYIRTVLLQPTNRGQLVTLFTIIFMTTIATLVKRYALWKAQEGATIAELEQYQASISLPSTIKMIVMLRVFNLASFGLVFIWSWYYLGSQAVSREFTFQLSSRKIHTSLIFPSAEVPSAFVNATGLDSVALTDTNSLFNDALTSVYGGSNGKKNPVSGSDLAGNAILPLLNLTSSDKSWCNTRANSEDTRISDTCMLSYASYFGFPVFASSSASSSSASSSSSSWLGTYELSTSYINANCSVPIIGNASDFPLGALPNLSTSFNVTNQTSKGYAQVNVWSRVSNSSIHTTCTLERHYIDARAECDTAACIINQARQTPGKAVSPATQFLDTGFSERFFKNLLLADGLPTDGDDESWVQFSAPQYYQGYWNGPGETPADLALTFSIGMTMLINTFMAASQSQLGFFYPPFEGSLHNETAPYFEKSVLNIIWPLAKAKGATYNPQYVLSIPWVTIDIITCTILFLAAMASFWLRQHTVAPDIFGYVSSMTRDNPHMHLPDGGSTMSGSERARALKHVRVKVADLNNGSGFGHIGLASADHDVEMGRLEKKKQYM
jgi:hypothetical protein